MIDTLLFYKVYVQDALLVAIALFAWRYGSLPERCAAFVLVVVLRIADLALHALVSEASHFNSIEAGHLLLDSTGFALFLLLALVANRIYPLCLTIVQGLVLLAHFAAGAAQNAPLAYSILSLAPFYLLIIILGAGIWMHRRREAKRGPYPDWRPDFAAWLASRRRSRVPTD